MEIIKIDIDNPGKIAIDRFVDSLRRGQVVAYPTDTIYGLGCLADDSRAIRRIFKIKERRADKPLVVLMSSLAMVNKYCHINSGQEDIINKQEKSKAVRPVTFILSSRGRLPRELSGNTGTLAIRLPKSPFISKIIARAKKPIVSTSLNISGQPDLKDLSQIGEYFTKHRPDLALDAGRLKTKKASRIIDIRDAKNIRVLRK